MKAGKLFGIVKEAAKDFSADSAPRLGASVAFYTIFSLSPMFLLVLAIATWRYGPNAAEQISKPLSQVLGPKGGEVVHTILSQPQNHGHGFIGTIIAIATLLLGSSGVFLELQAALNRVWEVKQAPGGGIWSFIKNRLLSFAMVLTIGFLLLVSLVLTAAISAFVKFIGPNKEGLEIVSQALNFIVSFGVITVLFAFIFKFMPDVRLPWSDVWFGAAFTSLLFAIGKFGLGIYLAKSTTANAYGAAGSLVTVLIWIFYSAQILFFGAEITQSYAKAHGTRVLPKEHAVVNTEDHRKEVSPTEGLKPKPARPYRPKNPQIPTPGVVFSSLVLLLALALPKAVRRHI
jgi:membrane protein